MTRYIATVDNVDGEYWISLPGIDKAYAIAKRPEDIIPNARIFLDNKIQAGDAPLPPSLGDAISEPIDPFDGTKLVVFEWEPPT